MKDFGQKPYLTETDLTFRPEVLESSKLEDQEKQVREVTQDFAYEFMRDNFVLGFGETDSFELDNYLSQEIEKISRGDEKMYEVAVGAFYVEVINFCEEILDTQDSPLKTEEFFEHVRKSLFSLAGGVLDSMKMLDHLLLTAKIARTPELKKAFSREMESEMVYKTTYYVGENEVESLANNIAKRSTVDVIDLVNKLGDIAIQSLHEVYGDEKGFENIVTLIEYIKLLSGSPLVLAAIESILEKLKNEQSFQQDSILEDLPSDFVEQNKNNKENILGFSQEIESEFPIARGSKFVKISKDAVGVMDSTNGLYAVAGKVEENGKKSKLVRLSKLGEIAVVLPYLEKAGDDIPVLLRDLHGPELRGKIEADFGVSLSELSLASQIHFLRFLSGRNTEEYEKLKNVLNKHSQGRVEILNSFLALSENTEYAEVILHIAEQAETGVGVRIFEKYNEIVNLGEEVLKNLNNFFGQQSEVIDINLLVKNLLEKANKLLLEYSQQIKEGGSQTEVVKKLESVQSEILVFASGIRSVVRGERMEWRNVPGVKEQEKDSSQLTPEEKQAMLEIFKVNREKSYPTKLFNLTVQDFEKTINETGHTFRLLYLNGALLAFFHYDENKEKNEIYVGSLNLNPNATDTPIAVSMIKDAMSEKDNYKLTAVVWNHNPARLFYTRMLGFKKVGEINNYHQTGEGYWELERPKQQDLQKVA